MTYPLTPMFMTYSFTLLVIPPYTIPHPLTLADNTPSHTTLSIHFHTLSHLLIIHPLTPLFLFISTPFHILYHPPSHDIPSHTSHNTPSHTPHPFLFIHYPTYPLTPLITYPLTQIFHDTLSFSYPGVNTFQLWCQNDGNVVLYHNNKPNKNGEGGRTTLTD